MKATRKQYGMDSGSITEIAASDGAAWLCRLHGLACGRNGTDPGPSRGLGLFLVETQAGLLTPSAFALSAADLGEAEARLTFAHASSGLEYSSAWRLCAKTGVWRRRDALANRGRAATVIRRARARFVLSMGRYEVFSQESRWCGENQGSWRPLDHGRLEVSCEGARTCQGSSPVLGVRSVAAGAGLLFHPLPRGAWRLAAEAVLGGPLEDPYLIVECGPDESDFSVTLDPGAVWALPEILVQELPDGDERDAAPGLHRFAVDTLLPAPRKAPPLIYNTWFDAFDRLDPARLERQLDAAASLGCETFVVDAGWFGGTDQSWAELVGDWREKTNAAFRGKMRDFARTVRSRGLGFGLWAEPERMRPLSPVFREHPEWFIPASAPGVPVTDYYPDLSNPGAYGHVLGELVRLVETYELAWMKIDYNHSPARDPARRAFHGFYERWYAILDELRRRFPALTVEGCASGGLRADLEALAHVDCHFLTDTVDPVDQLRIGEGALIRMPPGRMSRWLVLRSVGRSIIRYGSTLEESPESVVAPGGAVWEPAATRSIRFLWAVTAASVMGLSGDVAGLEKTSRDELARLLAAYKGIRETVFRGHARLLTPVRPRSDLTGWSALEIAAPATPTSPEERLLFAYRLDDGTPTRRFTLAGLAPESRFEVAEVAGGPARTIVTGKELARYGIEVAIERRFDARVFSVKPAPASR
jgi:alpha-galactosidase